MHAHKEMNRTQNTHTHSIITHTCAPMEYELNQFFLKTREWLCLFFVIFSLDLWVHLTGRYQVHFFCFIFFYYILFHTYANALSLSVSVYGLTHRSTALCTILCKYAYMMYNTYIVSKQMDRQRIGTLTSHENEKWNRIRNFFSSNKHITYIIFLLFLIH